MTQAPVAVDIHQTLDIQLDFFAQIAFDPSPILNDFPDSACFLFREVRGGFRQIHLRFLQNLGRARPPDSIDIGQGNLSLLIIGNIDTSYSHTVFIPAVVCV
jgi:hypothetical protein